MKTIMVVILILCMCIPFYPAHEAKESLPPRFCWRDINGIDYTTPVKNQEPAPTCEAYALCACLETLMQYRAGELFNPDLSEAHLFFYAGGTCNWGVNVSHAAEYLVEYGVPDEGCFPDPHREYDFPFESLPGWENRTVKITHWGHVSTEPDAIKEALIEYGPLVICIHVWKDFMYYRGGVYHHRWGSRVGGHLVALMGYDDTEGCWIVKNSWGTSWGEDGWVRISYDEDIFITPCYGGTGVLYVDGVYGNFKPDVPRVYIEAPRRYHTYIFGHEFPSLFGRVLVQNGIPRIIGSTEIALNVINARMVEFYLDGELRFTDENAPFGWRMDASPGAHTLEVLAYNECNASKAVVDVYVLA